MMLVEASNGELELRDGKVFIRKKGLRSFLINGPTGERSIPIASITAIQLKPAGIFLNGYIQFSYAGSKQFNGSLGEAASDPDALVFGMSANAEMEQFRSFVDAAMAEVTIVQPSAAGSLSDEFRKLAQLRDDGILTDAEFTEAKQKLLGAP